MSHHVHAWAHSCAREKSRDLQCRVRCITLRTIFFEEFIRRVDALKYALAVCTEYARRQDAFAVARNYRRVDAIACISSAVAAAAAQRQAQRLYRQIYDDWCKLSVFLFIRWHMVRLAGVEEAQCCVAAFKEEDRYDM